MQGPLSRGDTHEFRKVNTEMSVSQTVNADVIGRLAGGPQASTPLFSIIIPMRNEEQNITKCLASLQRLRAGPGLFEAIVVDNGSTDRTLEAAAKFRNSLALTILEKPDGYISAVRNAGAAAAQGTYLAFLDSDCEANPDWLQQASLAIQEGRTGIFGSFYLIPDGSSWVARHWYDERERKGQGKISFVPAGDLFVSRELFQKLRGFDESLQTNEDVEFCHRARAAGAAVTCIPELGVIHWGTPQSLAGFFRRHRWHGTHVFRVFLRSLPRLSNARTVIFAVYTLLCLLGIVWGAVWLAISGRPAWLAVSIAALVLPSLLLSLRMAFWGGKWNAILPLTLLHIVFGIARATCLLEIHGRARKTLYERGG